MTANLDLPPSLRFVNDMTNDEYRRYCELMNTGMDPAKAQALLKNQRVIAFAQAVPTAKRLDGPTLKASVPAGIAV